MTDAAESASHRGQELIWTRELAAAREAAQRPEPVSVQDIADEFRRLNQVETAYLALLEERSEQELMSFDYLLRYPLVKLAEDAYLAWTGTSDAPVSYLMTLEQVRARGWSQARIDRAEEPDEDGYLFNRGGPCEVSLTVAGLLQAYADEQAHAAFELSVATIQCGQTSDTFKDEHGNWRSGEIYWDPWDPANPPEQLPADWPTTF